MHETSLTAVLEDALVSFFKVDALESFLTDGFNEVPLKYVLCIKLRHGWYNKTRCDANFGWQTFTQ